MVMMCLSTKVHGPSFSGCFVSAINENRWTTCQTLLVAFHFTVFL